MSLPLNTESASAQPGAGRSPHDAARLRRRRRDSRCTSSRTTSGSITTTTATRIIDALCHVAYEGSLYNGQPEDTVTARRGDREHDRCSPRRARRARRCCSTFPRLRGVSWLEPGEHVFADDLEAAERAQGVEVRDGRHPACPDRPPAAAGRAGAVEHRRGQGRPASDGDAIRRRARRRGARIRRQQRHGPEQHRGRRLPDPRAGDHRDGRAPARLPAVRGCARSSASGPGAGSFCSPRRRCGSSTAPARR